MLNSFKIRTKLLLSFILVALIAGVIGIFSISNLNKLEKADTELYENVAVALGYGTDAATYFQRIRVNVRDAYIADSNEELNKYLNTIDELDKSFLAAITKIKATAIDATDKKKLRSTRTG